MKFLFLYTISAIITIASSRKYYDVEEEARKLYGEDLNSVLLRFRKSTDYMHILDDKVYEIWEQLDIMMRQVRRYFNLELGNKIGEILKSGNMTKSDIESSIFNELKLLTDPVATEEETPVARLEKHKLLHKSLTTSDINYYKALGFEYVGQGIHTILRHMGADDVARSTRLPSDEADKKTTTENDHSHHVTQSPGPETTTSMPDFTAAPDLLRYKIKKTINKG